MSEQKEKGFDPQAFERAYRCLDEFSGKFVHGEIPTIRELQGYLEAGATYHYQRWGQNDQLEQCSPFHSAEYARFSAASSGDNQKKAKFCQENARRAREAATHVWESSPAKTQYDQTARIWDDLETQLNQSP